MMLPVGLVTNLSPWREPTWLWLATPPLILFPLWERPAVEVLHTHTQWDRPAGEVLPLISPFYHSAPPQLLPVHKLAEGWANQIIRRHRGHAPRTQLLPGRVRGITKTGDSKDSPSAVRLLLNTPDSTGGAYSEWAGPIILTNQSREMVRPIASLERRLTPPTQQRVYGPVSLSQLRMDRWPVSPLQMMKGVHPSFFSSRFQSGFTLMTDYTHKRGMRGGELRRERETGDITQCDGDRAEEQKVKLPVASTPVPGSPWCVVWTGDDRVFFFNPTLSLSVWDKPSDLIGPAVSRIIEDPPHKRKRTCHSAGLHGDEEHMIKRNRESVSLAPRPAEVKLLPLEQRVAYFRNMMLDRGVSAFSSWEKQLHKMVFDSRYLLLNSEQRRQVFDQFIKSRVKDEHKEKKSKRQKAREEFRTLLEEAKLSTRSSFKEFRGRYRGDQRFTGLTRKQEQEVEFHHYITSLKRRDKR